MENRKSQAVTDDGRGAARVVLSGGRFQWLDERSTNRSHAIAAQVMDTCGGTINSVSIDVIGMR